MKNGRATWIRTSRQNQTYKPARASSQSTEILRNIKGQLISKWFLVSSNSSKKRTNEFFFLLWRHVLVHFLEEIEDTKNHFKIIWPLMDYEVSHIVTKLFKTFKNFTIFKIKRPKNYRCFFYSEPGILKLLKRQCRNLVILMKCNSK